MSSLSALDKSKLERLFEMSDGYVLNFSDSTMGTFFGEFNVDIHGPKFRQGSSKAKKSRAFWQVEGDQVVGETIKAMIELYESWGIKDEQVELLKRCKEIYARLLAGKVNLAPLKQVAEKFDLKLIDRQIKRMEESVEKDPDLAISTAYSDPTDHRFRQ
ncbi:MAG TPA: hypothetical protein VNJ08_10365 [Bacteriovoracaceae bacterium]|nr:hypothetical protein [Bacteriovoracaceae bacterium]